MILDMGGPGTDVMIGLGPFHSVFFSRFPVRHHPPQMLWIQVEHEMPDIIVIDGDIMIRIFLLGTPWIKRKYCINPEEPEQKDQTCLKFQNIVFLHPMVAVVLGNIGLVSP